MIGMLQKVQRPLELVSALAFFLLFFFIPSVAALAETVFPFGDVSFVLFGGRVIDGRGGPVLQNGVVVIEDGRIAAVGSPEEVALPDGLTAIDCTGHTVLPGLIDSHTHRVLTPEQRRTDFLLKGVTSVGNVGASLHDMVLLEQGGQGSGVPTATAFQSGPVITAPGGYPGPRHGREYALGMDSKAAARKAVHDLVQRGAELIKLALEPGPQPQRWPVLSEAALRTVVEEAHVLGLTVRCHVEDAAYLDRAIDIGVDVIDHVPNRWSGGGPELFTAGGMESEFTVSTPLYKLLQRMAAADILLVPTLDAATRSTWDNARPLSIVRTYHELGGRIALGTDAPFFGVVPGDLAREMELLHAAGLSNLEVITAATRHAAQACGQEDRLGTLEPGRPADLVVVDGDPVHDLQALRDPLMIFKAGRIVRPNPIFSNRER